MPRAPSTRLARSSLIGAAVALAGIAGPVLCSGEDASSFFSIGGLLLVGCGVVAVAFMSFDAADVRAALRAVVSIPDESEPLGRTQRREIANLLRWAHLLREGELRRLETEAGEGAADPLVRYGLNMILGEHAPAELRPMLETAAAREIDRKLRPVDILHAMASHAPAFGMVGTLVGMIAMLAKLDADPSHMGSTLALSFLSTLYGLLSARLLYMPAAAKLERRVGERAALDAMLIDGLVMLAERRPAAAVNDRLNGHLDPSARDFLDTVSRPTAATPAQSSSERFLPARRRPSGNLVGALGL